MPPPSKLQQMRERLLQTGSMGFGIRAVVEEHRQMGQELGWELAPTPKSCAITPQAISASNPHKHITYPWYVHPLQEAFDAHSGTVPSEQPNKL